MPQDAQMKNPIPSAKTDENSANSTVDRLGSPSSGDTRTNLEPCSVVTMIMYLAKSSGILRKDACRPHFEGAAREMHTVESCSDGFRFLYNSWLATIALSVSALEIHQSMRDSDNLNLPRVDCPRSQELKSLLRTIHLSTVQQL